MFDQILKYPVLLLGTVVLIFFHYEVRYIPLLPRLGLLTISAIPLFAGGIWIQLHIRKRLAGGPGGVVDGTIALGVAILALPADLYLLSPYFFPAFLLLLIWMALNLFYFRRPHLFYAGYAFLLLFTLVLAVAHLLDTTTLFYLSRTETATVGSESKTEKLHNVYQWITDSRGDHHLLKKGDPVITMTTPHGWQMVDSLKNEKDSLSASIPSLLGRPLAFLISSDRLTPPYIVILARDNPMASPDEEREPALMLHFMESRKSIGELAGPVEKELSSPVAFHGREWSYKVLEKPLTMKLGYYYPATGDMTQPWLLIVEESQAAFPHRPEILEWLRRLKR